MSSIVNLLSIRCIWIGNPNTTYVFSPRFFHKFSTCIFQEGLFWAKTMFLLLSVMIMLIFENTHIVLNILILKTTCIS